LIFRMFDQNTEKVAVVTLKQFFPEAQPPVLVESMWDFDKQHEKELGIKKGEVATVISKYDSTWWLLQNKAGETGYVAATFVRELESPKSGLAALTADKNGKITLDQFRRWAESSEAVNNLAVKFRNFSLQPPPAFELGGPTNFRHQTHIGFNNTTGGFEFTSLPEEWQGLFKQAGITPEEAANPETATFLVSVLQQEREKQMQRRVQAEQPQAEPDVLPPPLPPKQVEPEPEPETQETEPAQPTSQPPQTPLPPLPPQPPKRPAVKQVEKMPEPSMVNLLEEIRSPLRKLKTINPNEVRLDNLNEQETSDLVGILKKAMMLRRNDVDVENPESEPDNDDEWN